MVKKRNSTSEKPDEEARLLEAYSVVQKRVRQFGRSTDDPEDIAQDTYLRALRQRQPALITDLVGYLVRVARNLTIDRQRSRAREIARIDLSASLETLSDPINPERILIAKQRLEIVTAAIEELPPRCREAFRLRCVEGLSYLAIARQMNIGHSMVAKHLTEALTRVHRALNCADQDYNP